MSNEHEAQPGTGDVLGQYIADCKRDHEAEDESACTCCRHWREACASERMFGGAVACRNETCCGCGGAE